MNKKTPGSQFNENAIKEMDLCILYINNFPNCFVRINWIWADEKKGWWKVNFTKIGIPVDESNTWTLDDNHVGGEEWTMGGTPMKFQVIPRPNLEKQSEGEEEKSTKKEVEDIVKTLIKESSAENTKSKVVNLFRKPSDSESSAGSVA